MRTLFFSLFMLISTSLTAGELAGVTMPDTVTVNKQNLVLNGMALRSKAFFKVYVGGLYLPEKETNGQTILNSDTKRYMVMHWLRSVDKSTICEGWQDGLKANVPDASNELKSQFGTLCDYMQNAQEGDQFTFTYIPKKGTTVKINDTAKGTISGKPFADALFSSWIGPKPGPGESFKNNLLGK